MDGVGARGEPPHGGYHVIGAGSGCTTMFAASCSGRAAGTRTRCASSALTSLIGGYTRTNLELARTLLLVRPPAEPIAVLRPAMCGGVEACTLDVTRTDRHDAHGACDALGIRVGRDSGVAHYRIVARALAPGDPPATARAAAARDRLPALGAAADELRSEP